VPAVPADADAVTRLPRQDAFAHRVHDAGNLVARHSGILDPRPQALLRQDIAMADAVGLDADSHLSRAGVRDLSFDQFERPARSSYLNRAHLSHRSSLPLLD
jgi:hypothetical protein